MEGKRKERDLAAMDKAETLRDPKEELDSRKQGANDMCCCTNILLSAPSDVKDIIASL